MFVQVRKQGSDMLYALKEIRGSHPSLGQTLGERSASLKRLFNEVEITREQLRHPNIVLYHKCFQEGMQEVKVCKGCGHHMLWVWS